MIYFISAEADMYKVSQQLRLGVKNRSGNKHALRAQRQRAEPGPGAARACLQPTPPRSLFTACQSPGGA